MLGLLLIFAGCTTTKIDWNSRIGIYTYDQAVLENGPPDKYARLQDGTTVAEWLTHRGYAQSYTPYAYSYGYSPYWYGAYYPAYTQSYSPDAYLRLTFGPDGRLQAVRRVYK